MRRLATLTLCLSLTLAACGDDGGSASSQVSDEGANNATNNATNNDTGGDAAEDVAYPLFDLAATESPEGFYDYPFPSSARTTADGAPNLENFYAPEGVPLLPDVVAAIHRDVRGFSTNAGAYFRFTEPLDVDSLPAGPAEASAEGATAYVVDVDPDSPLLGKRYPVNVHFRKEEGRFWLPNTLVLTPVLGYPLRPGTLHAAVVTTGVTTESGRALAAPEAFTALLGDSAPPGREAEWEALQPAVAHLGAEAMRQEVAVATAFRTYDPAEEMRQLRAWIYDNVRPHTTKAWRVYRSRETYTVYEARFSAEEFFTGEPPYMTPGEGIIALNPDGSPVRRYPVSLRLTLTVPAGEPPEGGWPLSIYAHGTGGSSRGYVTPSGRDAAEQGVAMVGIDQPMHGARNPTGGSETDYLLNLALVNTVAGRDLFRHAIPDLVQLVRLVKSDTFEVPARVSRTGDPIRFDTTWLPFVGHSQGSQAGSMFIGVEPHVHSAFLSEGGGGASAAFLLRKANDTDIERLVALSLGIDLQTEPMGAFHPVVGVIIQPMLDAADPLNYARSALREPPEGMGPKHIVMTEGLEDELTLPITIEALAAAYGLPIVEPVHQPSMVHELWGLGSTALPADGNVDLGPAPVTGGLLQFPDQGHYPLFRVRVASYWFKRWIRSAADGHPIIAAP